MANLETLELTISGTSGEAKQGIDKLSRSLSYLSSEIAKSVSGLVKMNAELDKLKKAGAIRLPSVGAATSRASRTASTIANTARTPLSITNGMGFQPGYQTEAERMAKNPQWYQNPDEQARQAQMRLRDSGGKASWAAENEKAAEGYHKIAQASDKAAPSVKNTTTAIKETAKAAEESKPKVSGFSKTLEQIGRIAKTLLIRTALRSLLKGFSESWTAAYNYSKKMGGEFAQNVEKARGAISSVTTSLVQTFAPVLTALMPVIQTIASGINYLCTVLQRLFGLLGMGSDLFGVSAEEIDKYAESSQRGSKATKNLLASWDQLNIIQSKGGSGGGSGGGSSKSFFSDIISEELSGINILIDEGLLAVGLILACTGHVGIGVGMMAIGAAGIAKTLIEDWGKLPSNIQKTIARIMTIAGVGMLAVGLIMTCMGQIPIGIGLMALGALNLGAIMTASKTGDISTEVTKEILKIMVIASIGLLAVGLIIALFNPVMGIGLMIAGAGTLFAAKGYAGNDNEFVKMVEQALTEIGDFFVRSWESIKKVWLTAAKWFDDNVWLPIKDFAEKAWESISKWWDENIIGNIQKGWDAVSNFFKDLWGDTETGTGIAGGAAIAWETVSKWWEETGIGQAVRDNWSEITSFFQSFFGSADDPNSIAGIATNAWNAVSEWWTTNVSSKLEEEGAWGAVFGFFNGIIGDSETGIIGLFNALWCDISLLWGDIVGYVQQAWGAIGEWFYQNVTAPVGNFFIDCINGIIDALNWVVRQINTISVTIPGVNGLWDETRIGFDIAEIQKIPRIGEYANGGYGIPRGDLFIANEHSAELVGSLNGKPTVANQDQIVEGISNGVRNANLDQNALLREQNALLRALLEKDWEVNPSADWGRFNQRSNEMWSMATGR